MDWKLRKSYGHFVCIFITFLSGREKTLVKTFVKTLDNFEFDFSQANNSFTRILKDQGKNHSRLELRMCLQLVWYKMWFGSLRWGCGAQWQHIRLSSQEARVQTPGLMIDVHNWGVLMRAKLGFVASWVQSWPAELRFFPSRSVPTERQSRLTWLLA